jgi:hypothetical protein
MDLEELTAPMTPIPPWQSLTIAMGLRPGSSTARR